MGFEIQARVDVHLGLGMWFHVELLGFQGKGG